MPHINELIDFVTAVYITHQDKVLLIFHKKLQMWLPIGGHIELDEDPEQALLREIKEECGLQVQVMGKKLNLSVPGTKFLPVPAYMDIHRITDTHRHTVLIYFAKALSDAFIHNTQEHDDIRWFTREDLKNPTYKLKIDIIEYAIDALNSIV